MRGLQTTPAPPSAVVFDFVLGKDCSLSLLHVEREQCVQEGVAAVIKASSWHVAPERFKPLSTYPRKTPAAQL